MEELKIFEKLKTAYECSTPSNNLFKKAINSIKWENTFVEDSEYYYCYGDLCFVTPSLNPFDCDKYSRPSAMFTGGTYVEF